MRPIPQKHRVTIDADLFYKRCALEGEHGGRITIEHAIIFCGRQVAEMWNYVPLCERHHGIGPWMDAGTLEKDKSVWVALNRATDEEIRSISKVIDYFRIRYNLNERYGTYKT